MIAYLLHSKVSFVAVICHLIYLQQCYFFLFFRGLYSINTSCHFQNKISTKSITLKFYSAHVLYNIH